MYTKVIKRDGRTEAFRKDKVVHAIALAMGASGENDPSAAVNIATQIADEGNGAIHVEDVQDRVEQKLMQSGLYKVSKAYILYRAQRTSEREKKSDINRRIKSVVKCSNVQNSNANVNEYSFGGRKFEAANVLHKEMALDEFISPEVAKAHREGAIYIHDLSEYTIGDHNCLFADVAHLLKNGFSTRNGDVRPANSFATACQLVAVIFQAQSQCQFGGVASAHIDYDLAPYVAKSFVKHFRDGVRYVERNTDGIIPYDNIRIGNDKLREEHPDAFAYAIDMTEKEGRQGAQALFHNLNTLESRPGSQVPFTSLNYGTDTSPEGRLVNKWLLEASLSGIGKHNVTPIFPISVWKWKKGVNDRPGTPNYDLTQLALQSLSRRIYPNIVNCGVDTNVEDEGDYDTEVATMG